jgi:ABC-type oligopeptide transport system substrate-binding subunit
MWQGFVDPLSLMNFKVLPARLKNADDSDFAKAPIGSGPYMYKGIETFQDRGKEGKYAVFIANPEYEKRSRTALPLIREIRFFKSDEPAADFQQGRLHLLLDLPTSQFKDLKSAARDATFHSLPNRRIYFLAVNNRHHVLQNEAVRRAIAHAIDRESILNESFRENLATLHKALNGPYPQTSWAYDRQVNQGRADPHNSQLAKTQADKAKAAGVNFSNLTLKYPKSSEADDPALAKAIGMIQKQLQEIGIQLTLVPVSPRQLRLDVEGEGHNFELAYYSWDYPSEAYWLWPLFDPRPGGRNFLGYQNDPELETYFRQAMSHREFAVVQQNTHQIHARLFEKMPLIPLWQLDTLLAVHNSLTTDNSRFDVNRIDPLLIFTDVEKWSLRTH